MNQTIFLTEELERIKFLSKYRPDELASEQKALMSEHRYSTYYQNKKVLSEQKPVATGVKPGVKPGVAGAKPGAKPGVPTKIPYEKLTPEQKKKVDADAQKKAQNVYSLLKKAFDMDNDNDLKDWDGTNEEGAVKAINQIKDKNTLVALNKIIKAKGQFPDLKSWTNSEMSDFDHTEYTAIWSRLNKLGYKGAQFNSAMNLGGKIFDAAGGKGLEDMGQALRNLKNFKFADFMEGFRTFLNGLGGVVVQIMLSIFLPGIGSGINAFAWGALTVWDIYKAVKGKVNWMDLLTDLFGLITNGIAARTLGPAKAALGAETELPTLMQKMATKFPKIYAYVESLGSKLMGGIGKITQAMENAIAWIGSKVSWFKTALEPLKGVISRVGAFVEKIGESLGKTAVGKVVSKAIESMKTAGPRMAEFIEKKLGAKALEAYDKVVVGKVKSFLKDEAKSYGNEQAKKIVCSTMGKQACAIYGMAESGIKLKQGLQKKIKGVKSTAKSTDLAGLVAGAENVVKGTEKTLKGAKGEIQHGMELASA